MKEKELPGFVRKGMIYTFLQSKVGRIVSNWVFQGMLYMNSAEVWYKLLLDISLTLFIQIMLFFYVGGYTWFFSWLFAHTLNWIFNGQPVAMRRHLGWGRNNPKKFIQYVEGLQRRIERCSYLSGAASFGSLSRGNYRSTSDLDIRFIFKAGLWNKLHLAHFCFVERFRAAIFFFPLDLYAFELDELKRKMRRDEVPVIFQDSDGVVKNSYEETIPFLQFVRDFRSKVFGEQISDASE